MRHRLVYIAGRFRDRSAWVVHQNAVAAEQRAAVVSSYDNLVAVCPHILTKNLDSLQSEEYWCAATMEIMRRCDAVFVGAGWEDSRGTLGEIREALALGKTILFEEKDLRIYATKGPSPWGSLLMFAAGWTFYDAQVFVRTIFIDRTQPRCHLIEVKCAEKEYSGFGTVAWALSVVSYLRAGGYLNEVPGGINDWIDDRIAALQAAWEKS